MSHPLEFLLRGVRKAGFAEGLQTGRQEVEKELADLRGCVKRLEEKLQKEGNWRVAKVTQVRRDDNTNVREQGLETRPIRNVTLAAHGVVKSIVPVPIPLPIHLMNTQEVIRNVNQNTNDSRYCHPNPWGSISRRRGRHFRSCIRTSQSNFRSPNKDYIWYTIPPLRPTSMTGLVSSSLSFPARLFSRIWDRDEGVAMREGGTCGSGSRVPGIL
jgi:hypothetical protein